MIDKKLRKTVGERAKARRKELGLSMDYVAERMDVNKSTIQRYESGSIDNTKKLILEGLASTLHVSPEWLKGETDELTDNNSDGTFVQLEDTMKKLLSCYPLNISSDENQFVEKVLLLILKDFVEFNKSFEFAINFTSSDNSSFADVIGCESEDEFNNMMFLKEIMHTINNLNEVSDILRRYPKEPDYANMRVNNLLSFLH
ncbi:Transcriptional regulator, contains XRE-family HTH domain [Lachnospiraceae bacterium]|jgi:transcriptional regulator with XRE-family HTH domain|nr:Transcriptional regulator, contains XRE-family HTH domain [Lachnospiraceae bacterium]